MTTEYSISVDDWNDSKWDHVGVDTMRNYYENDRQIKKDAKDMGIDLEDYIVEKSEEHYPMMLYAYPIFREPSEKQIIDVCTKTCLTVVRDIETDDYYLALCGGGMDLSQSVAHAYLLTDGFIPMSLAKEVSKQPCLSVSRPVYKKIAREIKRQLKNEMARCKADLKEWNSRLKSMKTEGI